jgi:glycogen debranching enzyme
VWSHAASAIELCLFDSSDREIWRQPVPQHQGEVFFGFVEGIKEGQRYGLRAQGQWLPAQGQYFDPSKLLLDPYARMITRNFHYDPALSAYGIDTAHKVPKALAVAQQPALPLRQPTPPTLIYELNVRGFTMLHPGVPATKRGTISALAEPAVIEHFKSIGANTIELMPIAAWIDERHLVNLGLRNAWGYNPVSMFAVDPRLAPGGSEEVRNTVEILHAADINVILDVVFNHTGESDALGPILSLRGLDNDGYYRLFHGHFVNDAGTGNTLALDRPHTVDWMVEVLRHWVLAYGIDGFRFDLAPILGRSATGFSATAPLINAIQNDPVLASRILIGEPWDLGPGGYQLGQFPENWYEWNDKFRDDVRRFWRGDNWSANAVATRLAGSSDLFARKGRPSCSINFVSAHDGFTLRDLLMFNEKQNLANGENNRDGKSHEVTCNNSTAMALLSTLIFSRGTPMLAAGDEFGRTQSGNNNAYAQDNETTWLNWKSRDSALQEKFVTLMQLRAKLSDFFPDAFLTGNPPSVGSDPDVTWLDANGLPFDWSKAEARVICMVVSTGESRMCLALNNSNEKVALNLPQKPLFKWHSHFGLATQVGANSFCICEERAAL